MPRSAQSSGCDLLFISAHADDTELSCGGTIANAVRDGLRVGMIDLTRGEMGTRGTPRQRAAEAAESAKILGAAFRQHPEGKTDQPGRCLVREIWHELTAGDNSDDRCYKADDHRLG